MPQRKGLIPSAIERRLTDLAQLRAETDAALKTAVADALKGGGSVREVMRVTGLPTSTVTRWGRAGGWPTVEQQRAREEAAERQRTWARRILGIPEP